MIPKRLAQHRPQQATPADPAFVETRVDEHATAMDFCRCGSRLRRAISTVCDDAVARSFRIPEFGGEPTFGDQQQLY
jgi:hypothetical protein